MHGRARPCPAGRGFTSRILLVYTLISAATIGFQKGGYRIATTVFFLLLTLAATLVAGLGRPSGGASAYRNSP